MEAKTQLQVDPTSQHEHQKLAKQFERQSEEKKLEQLKVRLAEKMQASEWKSAIVRAS
jgi:hypothetical protein